MNIGRSATIVFNASAFVKRRVCRRISEIVRERDAKMAICDTLMAEYSRHISIAGIGPHYLPVLLEPLRQEGRLIHVKDEELPSVAPSADEDAHVINLAKAVGGIIVTSDKRLKEEKAKRYGLHAFYLREFLSDC